MARFRRIFKGVKKAVKEEINEVKNLEITAKDEKESEILAKLITAVCATYGVPVTPEAQKILIIILKYGIRDIKDGLKCHDKFIVKRIINEIDNS